MSDMQNLLSEIYEKMTQTEERRKENKERFNFFSAIVSGKHSKDHHEKYHSNFIAYLLDADGGHDFGNKFKDCFFEMMNEEFKINSVFNETHFSVEREHTTNNGRLIDIFMESTNCIVFLENKIGSGEQSEQMKDYCNYAMTKHKKRVGIYLTLTGCEAPSIKEQPFTENDIVIVNMSYHKIVIWLEKCCLKIDGVKYTHVVSCVNQYISILKNLLNIMREDKREILTTIMNSPQNIEAAKSILNDGNISWQDVQFEILEKMLRDIEKKYNNPGSDIIVEFDKSIDPENRYTGGFWFYKNEWKNCIYFYFEKNFTRLCVSVDNRPGLPSNPYLIEENITWRNTAWSEVDKIMPDEIQRCFEIYLDKYLNILASGNETISDNHAIIS